MIIYKSYILFKGLNHEYYHIFTFNQGHLPYARGSRFDYIINLWKKNIPQRLHNCMLPFYQVFPSALWGNIQLSHIDYDVTTYWNVESCDSYFKDVWKYSL
jgi:hypothetical protein